MYDGTHRALVRDNYNGVAKRVAAELALLHPDATFDPVLVARLLAHHTNALIDELKAQRDVALTTLALLHGGGEATTATEFVMTGTAWGEEDN